MADQSPPASTKLFKPRHSRKESIAATAMLQSASKKNLTQPNPVLDTPRKTNSSGTSSGYTDVSSITDDILDELQDKSWCIGETYMSSMLENAASDAECEDFLKNTSTYDYAAQSWHIPTAVNDEKELYTPFDNVITAVLKHFGHTNRTVHQSHRFRLAIDQRTDTLSTPEPAKVKSAVDLMVLGSDSEFDYSQGTPESYIKDTDRSYAKCLTLFDGKKGRPKSDPVLIGQVSNYARSCFNAQRNRTFIYHIVFNETEVRLFYFDHCGLMVSDWINYRSDPNVLIRIILLTCNSDSSTVGLDPAVKFRKASADDGDTENQQYERVYTLRIGDKDMELTVVALTWASNAISGRKTLCWRVKDKDDNVYILKECSRHVEREPAEWKLLEEVKGVEGVGQMVGYQVSQKISEIRCSIGMESPSELKDRERYFLLLEMYGYPIYHFNSRLQLLEALRDAVQGHWNLWKKKGVLHRDISKNNILLGNCDAAKGFRGVLIDLDLAIYTNRDKSLFGKDSRTGTHAFQSYMILSAQLNQLQYSAPQDYLDDLESFFWVLLWIVLGNKIIEKEGTDVLQPTNQKDLNDFEKEATSAAKTKWFYLSVPKIAISEGWGSVFASLLAKLRQFFLQRVGVRHVERESRIEASEPFQSPPKPLQDPKIQEAAEVDFPAFIQIFDEAIEMLKSSPLADVPILNYATNGLFEDEDPLDNTAMTSGVGSKRSRATDEGRLASKRSRGEGSRNQASARLDLVAGSSQSAHRRSSRIRAKRASKSQGSKLRE